MKNKNESFAEQQARDRARRGKLKKITYTYENCTESIYDDVACTWNEKINGLCIFAEVRGCNPFNTFKFDWVVEK